PSITNVDIYNPATNVFSSGTASPAASARQGSPVAVVVGTDVYEMGGSSVCLGAGVAPVDVYHTATNSWTTLPAASNLPAGLLSDHNASALCGAAIGTKIYFFGLTRIGVFDTTTNSWTVLAAPA